MLHAKLSPSASSRWIACPGSVQLCEKINREEKPSPYAEEGTKAHNLSQLMFNNPNEEWFEGYDDDEMYTYVREYFNYVMTYYISGTEIYTEVTLALQKYIPGSFGTADNVIVDLPNKTLHVFDLKYGRGVRVSAIGNSQARIYALGSLLAFDKEKQIEKIIIHICQPRMNHLETEKLTNKELMKFARQIKIAAKKTQDPDAPLIPGEIQCRWCKANAECKALKDFTYETISEEFEDLDIKLMTLKELSKILMQKKLIEKFLKDVEERITDVLIKGSNVPGFQIGFGRSNRKWDDNAEEFLIEKLGKDAFQKSLITLAKAEKLLGKDIVAKYTVKPQGKIIPIIKEKK